jgi:hypothetical protein
MRGRLIKVEALLGKLMEKVMPESLDAQSSMSGTAPAEKAQMALRIHQAPLIAVRMSPFRKLVHV